MGFLDRLEDDVIRVHLGAKNFEVDLVYVPKGGSPISFKGIVDNDSLNTNAGAENEINRGRSALAEIYAPVIVFPSDPELYSVINEVSTGIEWHVKQTKKEHGMYMFTCTSDETRLRGRLR